MGVKKKSVPGQRDVQCPICRMKIVDRVWFHILCGDLYAVRVWINMLTSIVGIDKDIPWLNCGEDLLTYASILNLGVINGLVVPTWASFLSLAV